jgi:hypothetical protein
LDQGWRIGMMLPWLFGRTLLTSKGLILIYQPSICIARACKKLNW